jgi:hypothetical protein
MEENESLIELSEPYKADKSDPPIPECPKIVDFDHWLFFNIVIENINFLGSGSREN